MRVPQNGWFIREDPIKMDDDWGYPYDSGNPHISTTRIKNWMIFPKVRGQSSPNDRDEQKHLKGMPFMMNVHAK